MTFRYCLCLLAAGCFAQSNITIQVNAAEKIGAFKPIYGYFGYDEPNYTYTPNGKKLVGELGALRSSAPVYIRTHFMLSTGDGTPGLKFGSTNAFTLDAAGKPVYDWTISDRIFDTYLQAGAKPFVEIGFMPQALSVKPDPYQATWVPGAPNKEYSAGWSYPPKDYGQWGELVYEWVKHCVAKYGRDEVRSWYWEVWNEPDISYWHGTPEEYDKLYDYAAAGVKRALPEARVGGPATTGPAAQKAAAFLRQFLDHCERTQQPLDFISYHAKGRPSVVDGHVRMGIAKNAQDVNEGFAIVRTFAKFRDLPIILSESDPEGCAACSARVYPQNAYRNGALYPVYTAAMMKTIFGLADRTQANIEGMLTWAFEFEGQPYFDGFRTLATNGVDKPVLNVFRMAAKMEGDRVQVTASGSYDLDKILSDGVRGHADIDGLAAVGKRAVSIMVFNYHDDDMTGPETETGIDVEGIPAKRVEMRRYCIDENHSNAWTVWKKMGSPQNPSTEQYAALEKAGHLEECGARHKMKIQNGHARIALTLPRPAVSLIQFVW